ncbi:Nonribosomal Peptide Synthase (NRPS) [Aspergillus melleus]|uniref:Nonribosomal Peptide Synthase (NRPS) n=1 Tax=Aspergillus melleus TaxID=138277 RepID=A0ACC3ATM6_9EURO|nr:Nonribosomal Peptide Synthase (NRPS) [Aspergillus melleus]
MADLRIPGLPEGGVQAMYRPSKLQETMILSTAMDPVHRLYVESYHFTTPGPIDLSQLDRILHDLAEKHSTLRSIVCWDSDTRRGDVTLAILDVEYVRYHARFLWAATNGEEHEQLHRVQFDIHGSSNEIKSSGEMLWRVCVSPLPHSQGCRLTLSYHHSLMDGTSARQLLNWIHQEICCLESAAEISDIVSVQGKLDSWRESEVQARLRQRYERTQPEISMTPPISLEDGAPKNEKGLEILARQIPTLLDPHPGSGAVPAWMGRLAMALALCVFQGTSEALFFETMSARRHLPPDSSQALGLMLATQPRLTRIHEHTSLAQIAQSMKSTEDICHSFTTGELRSMIPSLGSRLPVAFACQTDESYPWNGVGDWKWEGRETLIDMPLFLELMPARQGCFIVHLHYHRNRFPETTMVMFHNFICEALHWLQQVHAELEQYTFLQGVNQIRARDAGIDQYLHKMAHAPTDNHYPVGLSDVEANIVRHPGVKACGVIKGESSSGDLLLAMIETDPFQQSDWTQMVAELQAQMFTSLPSHMIPSHLVQIAGGLVTTGPGNIHWHQLASPAATSSPSETDIPSTPLSGNEEEAQLQYWTSQLKDSRPAEFLHDWPRPVSSSGQTLTKNLLIQAPGYNALQEFCRTFEVTTFAVLVASFRATHYRMTGVNDANIGTPIPGCENTANFQCLRTQIDESDSFENLVRSVQSTIEQASWNPDILLQRISSELERTSDNPLLRVAITMHSQHANDKSGYLENSNSANLDLQLHIHQEQDRINATVHAESDLFTSPTIDTLLSVFSELLERGLQEPHTRISVIPLTHGQAGLREIGLRQAHRGNYPRDSSIVDVFQQQVSLHPDTVAVTDNSRQLTYAELDQESENLASWLRTRNLAPQAVISVFAPRSSEAIVAIVGILKADLGYIPMDDRWPDSRVETILSSINAPRLLLLGTDMRPPNVPVDDLEMVPLNQAIRWGSCLTDVPVPRLPSPTSLAYIIYTSGSTGKPKGVMIEHRSVVCRMHSSTNISANGTGKPVAHMASLAFDASIWEIYTALLNGGTVVCIDNATVLDYPLLDEVFCRQSVRVAFITPALLKELLIASPITVGRLDSLVVGGDRTDPQSMLQATKLIGSGEVLNGYGPTENTCFSTSYGMPRELPAAINEVPIGQAVPESGAYVMDSQQRLMPAGVLGELVVTGDGLARGYTDDRLNKDRFITVGIEGHPVRAYRTGDLARYRPRDGLIECFGRMDHQVKLRGFRIELAEIEHVLKDQPGVDEAVVLLQQMHTGHDQRLTAFVTENPAQTNGSEDSSMNEKAHEELWTTMFGTDTYVDSIRASEVGRDFLGWKSMVDGNDIDKCQMNEWLGETITSIRNGANDLGHVVEIGTGSGMILFNLIDHLQTYTGLDPVRLMVDFVQAAVKQARPGLHDRVQLHVGTATDIAELTLPQRPDLVVVNSVAQYFPGAEYLLRLIQDLLSSVGAHTLFFGDMRSYALYSQFQVTKALHNDMDPTIDRVRKIMAEIGRSETELLVDPAFFMALPERFPDLVHHVEILPKRMHACNELSCYRYAAVVHAVRPDSPPVNSVYENEWIDADACGLTRQSLLDMLQNAADSPRQLVALSNIAHRKTILERLVVQALPTLSDTNSSDWLATLQAEADHRSSFEVPELFELACLAGFHVEVSWARQAKQHGAFDAVFHRIPPSDGKERTLFRFPSDCNGRMAQEFTNAPMKNNSSITETLRTQLQAQLPSYMVPTTITVLDHMPINHNGKVDRQALKEMKVSVPSKDSLSPDQAPRNHVEEVICQEFSQVLACPVGMTDSFYGLGGHSLMATRAIFQISRRLQCALSIRDLIEAPTPELLALHIASIGAGDAGPREQESLDLTSLPALEVMGWQPAARAVGLNVQDIAQVMPCSAFQEGVLSADVVFGGSASYLGTVYLSTDPSINIEALRGAWAALVAEEEMLRTIFFPVVQKSTTQGICGDTFLQAILKPDSDEIRRVSSIEDATNLDISLSSHVPVALAFAESSKLVLKIHHALYDGAYISSLLKSLSDGYLSLTCQPASTLGLDSGHIPFSTFIRTLQSRDLSEVASFWKSYLGGAPCASWPVSAPSDPRTQEERKHQVETVSWKGNARLLARRFHTTPAAVARAAVAMLIAAHSETADVVLGEVSTGRQPSRFVAGPCIATHPVRIPMTEDMSFSETVRIAAESYAHTMPHQQFGLAAIRRQSEHPGDLPFRVLYVYQHGSKSPCDPNQPSGPTLPLSGRAENIIQVEFPLVIEAFCSETTGQMDFQFTFDPTALPPKDAYWVRQQLVQILHAMDTTSDPQMPQKFARALISAEEREFLTQISTDGTSPQPSSTPVKCAHDVIREQARKTPEKIALQFEHTRFVTYRELDNWSTDLSHAIRSVLHAETRKRAFRHGQPLVPICFDKSIEMVVTILAVLKAGAAYVPLDIEHPVDRLMTICKAIDARLIIWDGVHGNSVLQGVSSGVGCSLWTTDDLQRLDYRDVQLPTTPTQSSSTLAYVLFTSGSTGTPKGVMVEHRNLTSFMRGHAGSTDCSWTSRRLAMLAYTFDASVGDIFGTLGKGGRLCLVRRRLLMPHLPRWLESLAISHLALTPTLGEFLLNENTADSPFPHLNTLVFGGESFRREILRHLPQEMTVWNGYGPTETAVEVTASLVQGPDVPPTLESPFVSIGHPVHENQIYILHPGTTEQVPIGVAGEVCIAGPQVSRGYLGESDLTSKYFIRNLFGSTGATYRTGDRARWHGDGSLEYLGRLDGQIKIRGLRIEPTEIAAAAQAHPLVKACAVTKVQGLKSEALVALAQVDEDTTEQHTVLTGQIQECIAARVPEYMIPAQVQLCTAPLPQTSSGKIDYRALTQMAEESYNRATEPACITRATPGSLEAHIARHWADVLGIADGEDKIDITTPFSQVGGDSIRAISLLAALRREGLPLHMTDLRQSATIQSQAAKARNSQKMVGDRNDSPTPEYMHLYERSNSIATVVLIHPFLAQSKSLEALIPFLDSRFNVILVDDPFFGTSRCPESVTAWARSYLDDLRLPRGHQLILGGYSFGGLIALEMAMLWQERTSRSPAAVVLLDPGTYSPTSVESTNEEEALSLLGVEQRAMASFQEHFTRHNHVLAGTRLPPVYHDRCLYMGLPARRHDGVAQFWKSQCPSLVLHYVDCDDHYALLKEPTLTSVGQVLNQHCCLSVATIDVSCRTASVSTSDETMESYRGRSGSIPTMV